MDRKELKALAKTQIKGNIGILFGCMIVAGLVISVSSVVSWLIAPAIAMGMTMIYLALAQGQKPKVGDVFGGFSIFGKAWWLTFLTGFFTMLWSCLFYIPGIIKAISYSMAPYVLAENPTMTAREALDVSKRITKGHKGELFVLTLSFIGWGLLCMITFGWAIIWVGPYYSATMVNAYHYLNDGYVAEPAPVVE